MTFDPDRYFATPAHAAEPDPRNVTFGFGRRVCPGRYIADNALFVTIAQVLAVYKIAKPVENGKVVEPEIKFEAGVVSRPVPYKASILPRSDAHRELLKEAEAQYPWRESDARAFEMGVWMIFARGKVGLSEWDWTCFGLWAVSCDLSIGRRCNGGLEWKRSFA